MSVVKPVIVNEVEVHGRRYGIDPPVLIREYWFERGPHWLFVFKGKEICTDVPCGDPRKVSAKHFEEAFPKAMAELEDLVELEIQHKVIEIEPGESVEMPPSFTPPDKDKGGSQ